MAKQQIIFMSLHAKGAEGWPFFEEMRSMGADIDVISGDLKLHYSHRIWLYVYHWPVLIMKSIVLAHRLIKRVTEEDIIVFQSHMMLFIYKKLAFFSSRTKDAAPKLVLYGFIYTPRPSSFLQKIREIYFRNALKNTDLVICYSRWEVRSIKRLVDEKRTCVTPVRYGIGEGKLIADWHRAFSEGKADDKHEGVTSIMSAGRSSRDYQTLVSAVKAVNSPIECHIVCDNYQTAPQSLQSDTIIIHRSTFGDDYIRRVLSADIIVIPLTQSDISAGQMVMLHALAAAKPVVITDIQTIREYVEDSPLIKLVPPNDVAAMTSAIAEIISTFPLSRNQKNNLRAIYDEHFSDRAHGRKVLNAIRSM